MMPCFVHGSLTAIKLPCLVFNETFFDLKVFFCLYYSPGLVYCSTPFGRSSLRFPRNRKMRGDQGVIYLDETWVKKTTSLVSKYHNAHYEDRAMKEAKTHVHMSSMLNACFIKCMFDQELDEYIIHQISWKESFCFLEQQTNWITFCKKPSPN